MRFYVRVNSFIISQHVSTLLLQSLIYYFTKNHMSIFITWCFTHKVGISRTKWYVIKDRVLLCLINNTSEKHTPLIKLSLIFWGTWFKYRNISRLQECNLWTCQSLHVCDNIQVVYVDNRIRLFVMISCW